MLALAAATFGTAGRTGIGPAGSRLAALLIGAACGAVNGWLSSRWSLPSFIVTLGMLEIARGGAYIVTASQTQYIGARVEVVTRRVSRACAPFLLAMARGRRRQFV